MITPAALKEIHQLQSEAKNLLSQRSVTRADGKRADLLIAKIAHIRQAGMSTDEQIRAVGNMAIKDAGLPEVKADPESPEQRAHAHIFHRYLSGKYSDREIETEIRGTTFLAGAQTPIFSDGPQGGFLVPQKFAEQVAEGRAAIDPLFDPAVVTLVQEPDFTLRPLSIPGWDLSSVQAVKVAETSQHNPDTVMALNTEMLNKWTYRVTLVGTLEFDEDAKAYGDTDAALARAFGVGFGRGVSADLVNGDGVTGPQGILTGAANSGVTTGAAGVLSLTDFTNIFFSVNKIYRESPKAAWLVADATMKQIRNAKDSSNRPLFNLSDDDPRICGKPVYVAPSLPSSAGSKGIVFGDLSHYYVHSSTLMIRRKYQQPGLIEYGKVAWVGLQMVDAVVDDPTAGALPPLIYATLHA
jgi:HK97 family phage major capsid protein